MEKKNFIKKRPKDSEGYGYTTTNRPISYSAKTKKFYTGLFKSRGEKAYGYRISNNPPKKISWFKNEKLIVKLEKEKLSKKKLDEVM